MNYSEVLCESVKIISESLLEGLAFDKTVECIITDDSLRTQGTYTVTDGSVSFTAYSENTSYRKNTAVYVTIPNGDYDNDKIITGKKVLGSALEPFIYNSPFSSIVDVSGNLIKNNGSAGLIANLPSIYYTPYYGEVNSDNFSSFYICDEEGFYSVATNADADMYYERHTDGLSCTIYEQTFENPFHGFTRLGLQAQFQAWLQEYNCISGNYGLKLTVEFAPEGSLTQDLKERTTRVMYLEVSDMIGSPYNFETYYNQEKVFDISSFGGVSSIKLEFFQDAGSFYNQNGERITYLDDFDNLIFNNLFVKDCRVCIGYNIDSYETEFVQLTTFDAPTYTSAVSAEKNKKHIELKWVHIDDEYNQIQMGPDSPYEFEIRWYRYILGEQSSDMYSGAGWTNIAHERNDGVFTVNADSFSAELNPDTGLMSVEQVKAVVLFGPAPGYNLVQELNEIAFKANQAKYYELVNEQFYNCQNRKYNSQGSYYTQDVDTRKIYRSNIIEFTNENSVINSATLDALQALTLICQDEIDGKQYDSYGNYLLYDQANSLIDKGQSKITRLIGCKLDLSSTEKDDTQDLVDATSIVWKFPLKNTMISVIDSYQTVDDYGIITFNSKDIIQSMLTSYGMPLIKYTIASNYSPSKANNFIECSVTKDGITYHAVKELTFGQSGTSGTDWTFVLDFDKNTNAIIPSSAIDEIGVTARLYNSCGQEEDISKKEIVWSFLDPIDSEQDRAISNSKISILTNQTTPNKVTLACNTDLNIQDLYILKATIKDWGDYELTAYLPIPLSSDAKYSYLSGATQIIYLTDGVPQYYNQYYKMHTATEDITNEVTFKEYYVKTNISDSEKRYMPEVAKQTDKNGQVLGYKLKPVSMYTKNLPLFGVQCYDKNNNVIWTQPILIIQNRYPSAMINKWNGKDLIINESQGAILSNMVGAGSKNDKNQFSGILMGDWRNSIAANTNATECTGLFGFKDGQMSFSFTDDGKATIGASTAGQILIDGNNSLIQSKGYTASTPSGMSIDLTNNTIIAKYSGNEVFKINGNTSSSNYLTITSVPSTTYKATTLLNVGVGSYFLRSINYTAGTTSQKGTGTYIDLSSGTMEIGSGTFNDNINLYRARNVYTYRRGVGYTYTTTYTKESLNATLDRFEQNIAYAQETADWASEIALDAENAATKAQNAADIANLISDIAYDAANDASIAISLLERYIGVGPHNLNGSPSLNVASPQGGEIQLARAAHIYGNNGGYAILYVHGDADIDGEVVSVNGTCAGSDRALKENINYEALSTYKNFFFNLSPVQFSMIKDHEKVDNLQLGFIAQDVQENLRINNITNSSIVKEIHPDPKSGKNKSFLALNYNSLFTLNVYMLQEAYKEIDDLKLQLKELKEKMANE